MMLLLVRSIPLSKEVQDAWRSVNVKIVRRSKLNEMALQKIVSKMEQPVIINLGNLDVDFRSFKIPVFNNTDVIRAVSHPNALRRTLNDFIPANNGKGAHWHKRGGFGGRNKKFHDKMLGECAVFGGDIQQHVEGDEFRVNTVGDVIVQAHRKKVTDTLGDFIWDWIGVDGIRQNGIIPFVKEAACRIPNYEYSVLGWDIIVGDEGGPKVIEINTSPGVNEPTAQRIVKQIERIVE